MRHSGRVSRFVSVLGGGSRSVERSLFLVALGLVLVGFAVALYVSSDRADDPVEDVPGMEDSTSDADAVIGPESGTPLEAYVAERISALDDAEGRRVAIVSFSEYLTEEEAVTLLADAEIGVLMVAFPAGDPTATSHLEDLRAELVAEAQEQLPELRSILPTVEDPEFEEFYAAEIDRYEKILASGNTPEVVYAAIIRSDASDLRNLAADDAVRLVDVGDSDVVTHGAALSGLRPEETNFAGDPATRPSE